MTILTLTHADLSSYANSSMHATLDTLVREGLLDEAQATAFGETHAALVLPENTFFGRMRAFLFPGDVPKDVSRSVTKVIRMTEIEPPEKP